MAEEEVVAVGADIESSMCKAGFASDEELFINPIIYEVSSFQVAGDQSEIHRSTLFSFVHCVSFLRLSEKPSGQVFAVCTEN